MEPFLKWVLEGALTITVSLVIYIVNRMKDDIKENKYETELLKKDLNLVKVEYVHKSDMKEMRDELNRRFDRIETMFVESLGK